MNSYALVAIHGVNNVVEDTADSVSLLGENVQPRPHRVLLVICPLHEISLIDTFRHPICHVVNLATFWVDSPVHRFCLGA